MLYKILYLVTRSSTSYLIIVPLGFPKCVPLPNGNAGCQHSFPFSTKILLCSRGKYGYLSSFVQPWPQFTTVTCQSRRQVPKRLNIYLGPIQVVSRGNCSKLSLSECRQKCLSGSYKQHPSRKKKKQKEKRKTVARLLRRKPFAEIVTQSVSEG